MRRTNDVVAENATTWGTASAAHQVDLIKVIDPDQVQMEHLVYRLNGDRFLLIISFFDSEYRNHYVYLYQLDGNGFRQSSRQTLLIRENRGISQIQMTLDPKTGVFIMSWAESRRSFEAPLEIYYQLFQSSGKQVTKIRRLNILYHAAWSPLFVFYDSQRNQFVLLNGINTNIRFISSSGETSEKQQIGRLPCDYIGLSEMTFKAGCTFSGSLLACRQTKTRKTQVSEARGVRPLPEL